MSTPDDDAAMSRPAWLHMGLRGMEQAIRDEVDGALTLDSAGRVRLAGVHAKYCDEQGRVVSRWDATHVEVIAHTQINGGTPFVVRAMRAGGCFARVERFDGRLPDDWPGAGLLRRRDIRVPSIFAIVALRVGICG